MKIHFLLALLVGLALMFGCVSSQPALSGLDQDYQGDVIPRLEPHGEQLCASGCALSRHPTPELSSEKFSTLLKAYSHEPMSEESPALEELLYFGPQTKQKLGALEAVPLDGARLAFLRRELERDHVVAEFRIIDEDGKVRVGLPPTEVSLDKRYVFEPLNTHDFQPPEASGTIKRVGLNHLWQRI
jgi:hypothetical protein